jgi:hypothetical protein
MNILVSLCLNELNFVKRITDKQPNAGIEMRPANSIQLYRRKDDEKHSIGASSRMTCYAAAGET